MKWLLSIVAFIAVVVNFTYLKWSKNKDFTTCEIRELFGVYCPGCGGNRSMQALVKGDFLAVFEYHFLLGYAFLLIFLYILINVAHYIKYSKLWLPKLKASYAYLFLIMVLLFTLARNTDTTLGRFLAP